MAAEATEETEEPNPKNTNQPQTSATLPKAAGYVSGNDPTPIWFCAVIALESIWTVEESGPTNRIEVHSWPFAVRGKTHAGAREALAKVMEAIQSQHPHIRTEHWFAYLNSRSVNGVISDPSSLVFTPVSADWK